MFRRIAIVVLVIILVSVVVGVVLLDAKPTLDFEVDGKVVQAVKTQLPEDLRVRVSRKFKANQPITNARVSKQPDDKAGHFTLQYEAEDKEGEKIKRWIRFATAGHKTVEQKLFSRKVVNGLGNERLNYELKVQGALSADGKQHCFTPIASSEKENGGTFTVVVTGRFDGSSRKLVLIVAERLGSKEPRCYELDFMLDKEGKLTFRPKS